MIKKEEIRVRFAPSPTGYLHVGGLRTALYNYLFARKNGGSFILRIEDTDQARKVEGGVEAILATLVKFLDWDEGLCLKDGKIAQKGDFGPYIQSERLEIYKKYAKKLVDEGKAYYCFCSAERLEKMRQDQVVEKRAPMYDRHCLQLSEDKIAEKIAAGEKFTIRLKVSRGQLLEFEDIIRGKVSFNTDTIDDQVLMKSDGFPTYHLANVVDDHEMKISHVIRGEEWLPSVPKHILIYQAFGWQPPKFAHPSLLLNPDKSKLSKRQGDVAVEDYLAKGYLEEVLINFTALLGWNPGKGSEREIFSKEELVQEFELEKVHKAGAVFDLKKLDWMNGRYIKKMSDRELLKRALERGVFNDYFGKSEGDGKALEENEEKLLKIINVEKQRAGNLLELAQNLEMYFQGGEYDGGLLAWKEAGKKETAQSLEKMKNEIEKISDTEDLEKIQEALLEVVGDKKGDFLWPLRVALSGKEKSPSPFELIWILGKKESIKRIEKALEKLK